MKKTPNAFGASLARTEVQKNIVEFKAVSVVRSLHLLRYPKKYVPWRLIPNDNYRNFGFREGEWYLDQDALYLDPRQPLAQKAKYIANTISYVRDKSGLTDQQRLREYFVLHSGLPEGWAGKIEYRDENFRILSPEDILPPSHVWRRMIAAHTIQPEPLASWLEGVAMTDFTPIPERPPDVFIAKEGQIFEALGGVMVRGL